MGINDLDSVVNEMDVQDRYRVAFRNAFKDIIFESKYRTDGLAYSEKNKLRMIIEQKHGYNFNSIIERAKVVAQVIRYIKTIHDEDPKIMPKVAVIGDENECFVLPVKDIINYISVKEYNWLLSPSSMYQDKVLINDLTDDDIIKQLYIYKPQTEFSEIVNKVKDINRGVNVPRTLTEKNIDRVYKYFTDKITLKRLGKKISPNDSVNLFVQIMLHPDSVMLNTHTKQLFTSMFKEPLSVSNVESYISFITEFSRTYTPKQKHLFTSILDRLIEDTTRRKQGEFFTPTIWVNKAHEYISSVYGEDWKEKYIVWDPAWGTGNLTRDYKFKELYVSTLNQSDIDTANQMGYNSEAVKFQYDFLNDPYEYLPKGLKMAIESGKEIIILMNPPYGTAKNGGNKKGNNKDGLADTKVGELMRQNSYDKSSAQLYAQFIYRFTNEFLGNFNLAFFAKSSYKTAVSFKKTRFDISKKMKFKKGFIFNAKHFDSTSDKWGVDFSIFKNSESNNVEYLMDVLDLNDEYKIYKVGEKILYSMDNKKRACDWIRNKLNKKQIQLMSNYPNFSSPFVINNKFSKKINPNGYIGGYCELSNSVYQNSQGVVIGSSIFILGNTVSIPIYSENFLDTVGMFAAKKLIIQNWLNDKDEYIEPNENSEIYSKFVKDSVVLSLFNNASAQASLRQIIYEEEIWNTKNNFFWMSKDEMMEVANQNNHTELYNDARTDSERYVHTLLFGEERIYDQLSDDAKDVLDSASNLVRLSFGMRKNFADDTNHLNSWDAGYAQLKLLWKEYYPEQFKEFRVKYKVLEDKMRPMVYELGFLIK